MAGMETMLGEPDKRFKYDLTGMKFGRLKVIEIAETPKYGKRIGSWWLCECECGAQVIVAGINMRRKNTRSCGCLRAEMCREKIKKIQERRQAAKEAKDGDTLQA